MYLYIYLSLNVYFDMLGGDLRLFRRSIQLIAFWPFFPRWCATRVPSIMDPEHQCRMERHRSTPMLGGTEPVQPNVE